jgi:hypothetical protein
MYRTNNPNERPPRSLSVGQAAKQLNTTASALRRQIGRGEVRSVQRRSGSPLRMSAKEVARLARVDRDRRHVGPASFGQLPM